MQFAVRRILNTVIVLISILSTSAEAAKAPSQQRPTPQPPAPQSEQPTPTPPASAGTMEFAITAYSNMEHGHGILEEGYRAVCVDNQGVVGSAKLGINAAVNGEAANGRNGYVQAILRPVAQYIRQGATNGSCHLTIC